MIQKFLEAKHWQLFILMSALPVIFQLELMESIFLMKEEQAYSDFIVSIIKFFPFLFGISLVVYFCWFWSMGIGLNNLVPDDLRQKVGRFKFALIYPIVYATLLLLFIILMSDFVITSLGILSWIGFFFILVPLHLLAMLCMIYGLYFIAKAYKTTKLQKKVTFSDFIVEFFMLWFFPIGIWFLQPKINKMVKGGCVKEDAELD